MKLLGNRVILRRVEESVSFSGFILADPFHHGQIVFEVVAVGPGRWVSNPRTKKSVFIVPEVQPGDQVVSLHWFQTTEHPDWHKPEYLDNVDGSGRIALDARFCLLQFPQPKPAEYIPSRHL